MGLIIDRRKLGLNTNVSVNRYMQRLQRIFKDEQTINLHEEYGLPLNLDQPSFHFDYSTGSYNVVTAGNDQWMMGDIIKRDHWEEYMQWLNGGGQGNGDEVDFEWTDIEKQYMDVLFDNLELPNLTKKSLESLHKEIVRSGYSTNGSNIDLMKSFLNSIGRRMSLKSPLEEKLKELESKEQTKDIALEISDLKDKIKNVAFVDDVDIRYKRFDEVITPSKKMVMFLILDVSGSIGEPERNLAKLFSKLEVMFLSKMYDECVIEYIIFEDEAHHVDYQEFFHGNISGGTVLFNALVMMEDIIKEKYHNDWNIYSTIFTDSGLFGTDLNDSKVMIKKLLPMHQFMLYVHIHESYYPILDELVMPFKYRPEFAYSIIDEEEDILTEFIRIFSKKGK